MLIVPGRPTSSSLTWWVLADSEAPPVLALTGGGVAGPGTRVTGVGIPSDESTAGRVFLVSSEGLDSDTAYRLSASDPEGNRDECRSRTLPGATETGQPFTFSLGSCYSVAQDKGLGRDYPPPRHGDDGPDPVRFRILCGDQLYMDLSPNTGLPIVTPAPDPWKRYVEHWSDARFRPFLAATPTLAMADDHEFWNDYPHSNAWLLWDENRPRGPLGSRMDRAFSVFQAGLNLEASQVPAKPAALASLLGDQARTFAFTAGPGRFFFLDTRTGRTRFDGKPSGFTRPEWLDRATAWLGALPGPGILVVSQPVVETQVGWFALATHTMGDVNLPDYQDDFARLWKALMAAPHDVLVLSGDIHWSRLYRIAAGTRPDHAVLEVISSPLSLIPGSQSKTGEARGKVDWNGGSADWTSVFANNERQSYATVSLIPTGTAPAAALRVEVAWWSPTLDTQRGPDLLGTAEWTLR
jgi:hypothetical protein